MKKRFRSLVVLATMVALVLSMSGIAFAQFSDVAKDAPYATHVEQLNSLGIAKGYPDGTFGVNQPMTRQEFAVFVVRAMGKEKLAEGFANNPTGFKDDKQIGDWARGAVYLASQMGIIAGYPDGTFKPQGNVTQAEALTMLVRALGFKKYAEDLGSWPVGYLVAADNLGITEGLTVFPNVPMVRSEMAIALANTLFVPTLKKDDGSPEQVSEKISQDQLNKSSWIVKVWNKPYSRATGVTGTLAAKDITTWNYTFVVDGKTYDYKPDKINVIVNRGDPATYQPAGDIKYFKPADGGSDGTGGISNLKKFLDPNTGEGSQQVVVYATGNTATTIEVIYWNIKNWELTAVDSKAGTIKVQDSAGTEFTVSLDKDVKITIDGQTATPKQLEDAFKNAKAALVSVRVAGRDSSGAKASGDSAVEVAVLINNTVSGKVTATGEEVDGKTYKTYAVIDGKKVYYKAATKFDHGIASSPNPGDPVVWLLGSDGVAYLNIESESELPDKYHARYVGKENAGPGKETYTYQFADGSTVTSTTAPTGTDLVVGDFVAYDGTSYTKVGPDTATGTTITKLSATSVKVGDKAYAIWTRGAWVDDQVRRTKTAYANWTVPAGIGNVYLFFNSNGEVDLIIVTPSATP